MRALIACLLFCGSLFAQEFQLELLHEFEIPEPSVGSYYTHPWDVQFWMNDSIPGWAVIRNDTLYYRIDLSQDVQSFALPTRLDTTLCEQFDLPFVFTQYQSTPHDSYLLRWPTRPSNIVIATIQGIDRDFDELCIHEQYLFVWDVTDWTLLHAEEICHSYHIGTAGAGGSIRASYREMTFTPPLPAITSTITYIFREEMNFRTPGDTYSYYEEGNLMIYAIADDSLFLIETPSNAAHHSSFARSNPISFACTHSYLSGFEYDDYSDIEAWSGFSSVDVEGVWNLDTLSISGKVLSQTDADGSRRILLTYLGIPRAFSSPDHEQLYQINETWYNYDKRFSARCGSLDEQFWMNRRDSTYFSIYRASNGNLMGRTSDFLGEPQYMIKSHPLYDRLVTYDEETYTVRIYGTPPVIPLELIIRPAENNTMLSLDWQPVPGANSYKVWYKDTPADETPYLVGTTSETNMTFPMPINDKGFFYVEVNE